MARYALLVVGLLALCALASAQYWPAGKRGAEKLEDPSAEASIAASYDQKHKHSTALVLSTSAEHAHGHKHKKHSSHKDKADKYEKKPDKPLPAGKHPKGYKAADPDAGPKSDDEWYEDDGDLNTPYSHVEEHEGGCIGSRHVAVTGPANPGGLCPPQTTLFDAQRCDTPAFCGKNGAPFENPLAPCACPEGEFLRFDAGMVEDHFTNQPGPFPMADVTRHPFECVDARGESPMLGTPGGDLAELMAAAMAIMKLRNVPYSEAIADEVFDIFANEVASPERPLYFHTDDGSLRRMFQFLKGKLQRNNGAKPSVFPWRGPTGADGDVWISALKEAQFNGCGHIRLQIDPTTVGFYSVRLAEGVEGCGEKLDKAACVDAAALAQRIIERFFRYWWFTPSGSDERQNIAFAVDGILEGPLLGKAVTIIRKAGPEADACPDHHPLVRPTFGASQVFVYHGEGVLRFRGFVGTEYFGGYAERYGFTVDDFIATWTNIANLQLGATLSYLEPANRVGQFLVDVPIKEVEDEEGNGDADEYGHGGRYYGNDKYGAKYDSPRY